MLKHRIPTLIALVWFIVAISDPAHAEALSRAPQSWPAEDQITRLRAAPKLWASLRTSCEKNLHYVPHPVANFDPPLHYVSPEGGKKMAAALVADGNMAYQQALCYTLSNNLQYASAGEKILDAWSIGVHRIMQGQGAMDFNFVFPRYALAAAMLRQDKKWDDTNFRTFLQTKVLPLSLAARRTNNPGNWGVLLEASSALYLQDKTLMQRAASRWRILMTTQVAPDGSLPNEICRSDTTDYCGGPDKGIRGIAYTHFTLLPTTLAAEIFRNAGTNVYTEPSGYILATAYASAAAWTQHPETSPYYASNHGKLQDMRNAAYFLVLQRRVPNADGAEAIAQGNLKMDDYELHLLYGTG